MANVDAKQDGKMEKDCVVRNIHITVEMIVSQRFIISKSAEETIDGMLVRLRDECRNPVGKKDCERCRNIVKWAEECGGKVCNVVSNYDVAKKEFILDVCVDFKSNTDSNKFCNEVVTK